MPGRGWFRAQRASHASRQYDPAFLGAGIQVAQLMTPLAVQPYRFPGLAM